MSILIKGMEVPKDNTVLLRIYPKNDGVFYVEQLDIDGDILDKYWAVPVPPHGDLIDRETIHELVNWTSFKPPFSRKQVRRFIDNAPTIIPAEEAKE